MMTATAQPVQFTPDPFKGPWYTVAVVVRDSDAPRVAIGGLPSERCLGNSIAAASLRMIVERIRSGQIDDLAHAIGPLVSVGPATRIPEVVDPLAWAKAVFLRPSNEGAARRTRRSSSGWRFLQEAGVAEYVRKNVAARDLLPDVSIRLNATHAVIRPSKWLLMEPLIGNRELLKTEAEQVGSRFVQWEHLLEGVAQENALVAYALDVDAGDQRIIERAFRHCSVEIVNVNDPAARAAFIAEVSRVGQQLPAS